MPFFFRFWAVAALFLVVYPGAAGAAGIAERLQKAYATVDSLKADFTQVLVHKESGSRETRKGVLQFKKPLLLRWETRNPSPELLLVGRDAIWNAFPDEELAYKYTLAMAEDSRSLVRVITGQARLDQDFDVEEEGREDKLVTVRIYPKEPAQSLVEAVLWLDAESWLIKKVRVFDFYGNENEITFGRLEVGAKLPDALFRYSPPKDFAVEDRTRGGAGPAKPLLQ